MKYRVIINEIDHPVVGDTPSPGEINLEMLQEASGIQLMEAAVTVDKKFHFTASFNNAEFGYFIESIGGVVGDDCVQFIFYYYIIRKS